MSRELTIKRAIDAAETKGLVYTFVLAGSLRAVNADIRVLNWLHHSKKYTVMGGPVGFVIPKTLAKRLVPGALSLLRQLAAAASKDESDTAECRRICRKLHRLEESRGPGWISARFDDFITGQGAKPVSAMYGVSK